MPDKKSTEPSGQPPHTTEPAPSASEWTPLFDALCAELGHPVPTH